MDINKYIKENNLSYIYNLINILTEEVNSHKDIEIGLAYNKDTDKLNVVYGEINRVSFKHIENDLDNIYNNYTILHNHISNYTFSLQDIFTFIHFKGIKESVVITQNGVISIMIKTSKYTDYAGYGFALDLLERIKTDKNWKLSEKLLNEAGIKMILN